MPTNSEQASHLGELEESRVARWRLDQFRSLGFSEEEASRLAACGADLQLTRSLIAAQCPRHLALRIVA
jgi:hypothetical protein